MSSSASQRLTDLVNTYLENVLHVHRRTYQVVLERAINSLNQNGFILTNEGGVFVLNDKQDKSQQATTTPPRLNTPRPNTSLTPVVALSPPPASSLITTTPLQPTKKVLPVLTPIPSPVERKIAKRPRHIQPTSNRAHDLQFEIDNLKQLKNAIIQAKLSNARIELKPPHLAAVADVDQTLPIRLNDIDKANCLAMYYNNLETTETFVKAMKLKACTRLLDLYMKADISLVSFAKQFGNLTSTIRIMATVGRNVSIVQEFAGESMAVYEFDPVMDICFSSSNYAFLYVFEEVK